MGTPKKESSVRRHEIVGLALEMLSTLGPKALNMAVLAHRLGLVPSAIYRHFHSKQEIVEAIFGLIRERFQANIGKACQEAEAPLDQLERLIVHQARMVREVSGIPRLLFSESQPPGLAEKKAQIFGIIKDYIQQVALIIERGQREGQIRAGLDARELATMFWGLLPPATVLWHLSEGRFDVTRHLDRSWKIFRQILESEK